MTERQDDSVGIYEFIPVSDLADTIGISTRGIRVWIEQEKIEAKFIKKERSPGQKGYRYLINPEGIPGPYRLQYHQHVIKNKCNEDQTRKALPNWAIEKAAARLDLIHFLEQELSRAKEEGRNITPVYQATTEIFNSGYVLENAYEVLGNISRYTLRQKWWPTYKKALNNREDPLLALAPKYNTNKGKKKVPNWYTEQLKRVVLHPNQITSTQAIKVVNSKLRRRNKKVPCSIKTAHRWIKDFKDEYYDQWVLMREGAKALNDKVLPYLDRDWNVLKVGQVLIADGHVLNFDVKHPFTGKAHRPTLICFYDGRSRMPVGLSIMPTENTDNISEALADAVRTLGKFPDAVILDNGRAFKAKHFTESPEFYDSGLAGIYERYGIITHFTKPYHSQSKPIEPFFKQLNERFSKMLPTYIGNSISNKVARLKRNEKLHIAAYKKQVGDWLPTIPEVVNAIKRWSMEVYGKESHGGLRKGETPVKVFQQGQGPGVPYFLMRDLLLKVEQKVPRRARITIEGIVYENNDVLTGWKKPVVVRYTRREPEFIWIFDHTSGSPDFMCIAQAVKAVHPLQKLTNEDGEFDPTIREALKQRKRLKKRAIQATEELRNIDSGIPEPVGKFIPNFEKEKGIEIQTIPNEEPDQQLQESEQINYSKSNFETVNDKLFEHPYERFEHIAKKEKSDINDQDIAFLKDFMRTSTYTRLYEEEHTEWINNLLKT